MEAISILTSVDASQVRTGVGLGWNEGYGRVGSTGPNCNGTNVVINYENEYVAPDVKERNQIRNQHQSRTT